MVEHAAAVGFFGSGDQKMMSASIDRQKKVFHLSVALCLVIGILFRIWRIWENDFFFYDEGFYLNHNRTMGMVLTRYHFTSLSDLGRALWTYITICLGSGKSLWFAIADMRFFWGGLTQWSFARVMASAFGIGTLIVTYRFAQRWYGRSDLAWVAVAILAVLPSHVFYSRIGMQEALSTFLVTAGFLCYLGSREYGWRTFAAGMFWGAAFFSNYRLIMLPALVLAAEGWMTVAEKSRPDLRRVMAALITFAALVILIGNLDNGRNARVTFAWMFHQGQMAEKDFSFINFLSYPYYLFRLEGWLLGAAFFSSAVLFAKRRWRELLPFVLSVAHMVIFSLPSEKGARYVCVMLPMMAIAVAYFIMVVHDGLAARTLQRWGVIGCAVLMIAMLGVKSFRLVAARSDYRSAAEDILAMDPQARWMSTQSYVQNLYVDDPDRVAECPHTFEDFQKKVRGGYDFLVVDSQVYISWTDGGERFAFEKEGYLSFLTERMRPIKVYDHFQYDILERFVFEHSSHLTRSIRFLADARERGVGRLYVYNARQAEALMNMLVMRHAERGGVAP